MKMVIGGLVLVGVVTGVAIWANWIDEDDASDASFFGYVEVTCIALSNSVGFVKITLLLSYGLVELPRAVWRSSKWADDGNLNRHRLQVAREHHCVSDARVQLQLALDDWYRYRAIATAMRNREKGKRLLGALEVMFREDSRTLRRRRA